MKSASKISIWNPTSKMMDVTVLEDGEIVAQWSEVDE